MVRRGEERRDRGRNRMKRERERAIHSFTHTHTGTGTGSNRGRQTGAPVTAEEESRAEEEPRGAESREHIWRRTEMHTLTDT